MSGRTVKVSNVSHSATEQDIEEFFSFSGDIAHVEIKSFDEWSRVAYVTFRDLQGAETAVLLSGATIVDQAVIITIDADYQPPRSISLLPTYEDCRPADGPPSAIQKAGTAVSTVLARGYVMGRNTAGKAKSFNEKHQITSTAAARVVSLDRKIGLSEKIGAGASAVGGKVAEVDRRFRVSGRTKAAISAAEQKVFIGVSMVAGAFSKVGQAAGEVGSKTRAKALVEQLKRGTF